MAFSKKKIEERKAWLTAFEPGTFLDMAVNDLSYQDFVNKELILFSRADLERSIPNVMDGLKPGQRKIMFSCFKKKLYKEEVKVRFRPKGQAGIRPECRNGEQPYPNQLIAIGGLALGKVFTLLIYWA